MKTDNNIIHFGIDYLRLNFPLDVTPKTFEYFFEGLSANSPHKEVYWYETLFTVVFSSTAQKLILQFLYNGAPVLCLEKITDQGIGRHYSYILKFYSAYFNFSDISNILKGYILAKYRDKLKITRLDICLDIDYSVDDLLGVGYKTQFKVIEKRIKDGKLLTLYLGPRDSSNKKHFVRIYNKKADTLKKSKFNLYLDYFAYEDISRIEVQINSQSCKQLKIGLSNISDADFLKQVFKSTCINESGTYLKALDTKEFENLEIIRREAPPKSQILDQLKYAKVMLGYAQNLTNVGFEPIPFLSKHLK